MTHQEIIQIITGFLGAFGFSILFNLRGVRLLSAALGGFLSWSLFVLLSKFISDDAINYFLVAALVSIFAEVMARCLKTPTTTFITSSLIPLIPGGSLYYTMAYAFDGDAVRFIEKGISTVKLAAALALGIIVVTAAARLFTRISHQKH